MFQEKTFFGFPPAMLQGFFPVSSDEGAQGKTRQSPFKSVVPVLYARKNSIYKTLSGCDVYDESRDARTFLGCSPVIAHPPCRLWGRLRQFSTAPISEKELAHHAVAVVRRNGGVLEHPASSTLWPVAGLPRPGVRDSYGGFTLPVLQSWRGHKAPKATWFYFVGLEPQELPAMPFVLGIPEGRISDSHSMLLREGTPLDLALWLLAAVRTVAEKRAAYLSIVSNT